MRGKKRTEAQILKAVMMEASRLGMRVFRNETGLFYAKNGTPVSCGLRKGSGDLIGWTRHGRFASLEIKKVGGRASKEQINWMEQVQAAGGFACIIDDEKKLKKMLEEYEELM